MRHLAGGLDDEGQERGSALAVGLHLERVIAIVQGLQAGSREYPTLTLTVPRKPAEPLEVAASGRRVAVQAAPRRDQAADVARVHAHEGSPLRLGGGKDGHAR